MKPEVRDPYIMSSAADVGKKQTTREVGVPYLPVVDDGIGEIAVPVSGMKKALKIGLVVALVALFIGLGIVCLADSSLDLFKLQPPAGSW